MKRAVLSTGIGGMPQKDAGEALSLILKYVDIPFWPQLPRLSELENMYVQFAHGFPAFDIRDGKIRMRREGLLSSDFPGEAPMGKEYARGFFELLGLGRRFPLLKGQITGPVSLGLVVSGEERPIIYDEDAMDLLAEFLMMRASWQEARLSEIAEKTIIFVDEHYLPSTGSAFVSVSWERVRELILRVISGIKGVKGIHCCTSMDWSLLLELPINILSIDAYSYGEDFVLYKEDIGRFVKRGGTVAWGIVPSEEEALRREDEESLFKKLFLLLEASGYEGDILITPSCGLSSLTEEGSKRALEILKRITEKIKEEI